MLHCSKTKTINKGTPYLYALLDLSTRNEYIIKTYTFLYINQ